jgi:hypothetical protein
MFNERPYGRGRIFRPERDAPLAPVNERVHFFFYHIRRVPDPTLEQFRMFKYRGTDLFKTKTPAQVS